MRKRLELSAQVVEIEGGGSEVLVVAYGYDSYNQSVHKEFVHALKSNGGGDDLPRVIVMTKKEPIVFRDDITIKIGGGCLCPRHNAQGTSDNDLSANSRND